MLTNAGISRILADLDGLCVIRWTSSYGGIWATCIEAVGGAVGSVAGAQEDVGNLPAHSDEWTTSVVQYAAGATTGLVGELIRCWSGL